MHKLMGYIHILLIQTKTFRKTHGLNMKLYKVPKNI